MLEIKQNLLRHCTIIRSERQAQKGECTMLYSGCQSKSKEISITEKICPQCGNTVELFSTDTEVTCDKCGFVIYNDMLSCVQWCKYARKCVGDQMYEQMMEIAKHNKEKAAKERAEKAAAKAE